MDRISRDTRLVICKSKTYRKQWQSSATSNSADCADEDDQQIHLRGISIETEEINPDSRCVELLLQNLLLMLGEMGEGSIRIGGLWYIDWPGLCSLHFLLLDIGGLRRDLFPNCCRQGLLQRLLCGGRLSATVAVHGDKCSFRSIPNTGRD